MRKNDTILKQYDKYLQNYLTKHNLEVPNWLMGVVYKATNKVNKKVYIGITTGRLMDRKNGHIEILNSHSKKQRKGHFHRALIHYGKENFKWEVIDLCYTYRDLYQKERFYIAEARKDDNCYNYSSGGDGILYFSNRDSSYKIRDKSKFIKKSEDYYKEIFITYGDLFEEIIESKSSVYDFRLNNLDRVDFTYKVFLDHFNRYYIDKYGRKPDYKEYGGDRFERIAKSRRLSEKLKYDEMVANFRANDYGNLKELAEKETNLRNVYKYFEKQLVEKKYTKILIKRIYQEVFVIVQNKPLRNIRIKERKPRSVPYSKEFRQKMSDAYKTNYNLQRGTIMENERRKQEAINQYIKCKDKYYDLVKEFITNKKDKPTFIKHVRALNTEFSKRNFVMLYENTFEDVTGFPFNVYTTRNYISGKVSELYISLHNKYYENCYSYLYNKKLRGDFIDDMLKLDKSFTADNYRTLYNVVFRKHTDRFEYRDHFVNESLIVEKLNENYFLTI